MSRDANFTLDPIRFKASHGTKESAELTAVEYRILSLFLKHKLKPISKDTILNEIWRGNQVEKKTINVHLSHLRKKLINVGLQIKHIEKSNFCIESTQLSGLVSEEVAFAV